MITADVREMLMLAHFVCLIVFVLMSFLKIPKKIGQILVIAPCKKSVYAVTCFQKDKMHLFSLEALNPLLNLANQSSFSFA